MSREPTCLIVAEAGVNHGGDFEAARELVRTAARCGADAVKFQTFHADHLAAPEAPTAHYQRSAGEGESQRDLLRGLELSPKAHRQLMAVAKYEGIEFLSTPYDDESADLLESIGVSRFKLPSGELTNLELIRHVASKQLPIILSTGMATLDEVSDAVDCAAQAGCSDLTLLHCTSSYPADPAECNLRAMQTLRDRFGLPVGYSDHTRGSEVACAAVALGAVVVEKHFTLDRALRGPDHLASIEPDELRDLVAALRNVRLALGSAEKGPTAGEQEALVLARRGLCAARDLPVGCVLRREDLLLRRPATGLPPNALPTVLGRALRSPLGRYAPLRSEDLA